MKRLSRKTLIPHVFRANGPLTENPNELKSELWQKQAIVGDYAPA
jgi:hypothetical protein